MKDLPKDPSGRQKTNQTLEWTVLKLLKWSVSYFETHRVENPRASAEILLSHVLNLKRIELYVRYEQPVVSSELKRFKDVIKRRIEKEPVAYIVGHKGFWSMDFKVTPEVLIPRPETEHLVEAALTYSQRLSRLSKENAPEKEGKKRILELGTGSGAIILSLASELQKHLFFASDISPGAIRVARINAGKHQLENRVSFFLGSWFSPLREKSTAFNLIISNPPYIPTSEIDRLQPETRKYEPRNALDGGADGLDFIRHLIQQAYIHLVEGGALMLEIGHDQKDSVETIAAGTGRYENVSFFKDLSGFDRVACMIKKRLMAK